MGEDESKQKLSKKQQTMVSQRLLSIKIRKVKSIQRMKQRNN